MTRDQFLIEAMGECWHEPKPTITSFGGPLLGGHIRCKYCGISMDWLNTPMPSGQLSFSTPDGFFKLWNWATEQEWWEIYTHGGALGDCFLNKIAHMHCCDCGSAIEIDLDFINPDRFADALYEFLKEVE